MRAKHPEHQEAVRLRWEGLSYSQIARRLNVSTGSLSRWLRAIPATINHRAVVPSEAFRTQGARLHADRLSRTSVIIQQARGEIGSLSLRELTLVGAALYWAEGSKDPLRENVDVANSDPRLIQLILRWFRVVCAVPDDKLHVHLHIHTDLDLEECLRFWMQVTGLPRGQFAKPQIKHSSLGYRKKRSYRGTVSIRVHDRQLYRRIQGWIQGFSGDPLAPVAQTGESSCLLSSGSAVRIGPGAPSCGKDVEDL